MEITQYEYDLVLKSLRDNQDKSIRDISELIGVRSNIVSLVQFTELKKIRGEMNEFWDLTPDFDFNKAFELTIKQ